MGHLKPEVLARLIDEAARPEEEEHLAACAHCAAELEGLARLREELGSLPDMVPPMGDWDVLEARMRSEGLIRDPGLIGRLGLARTPGWMRAAAAVLVFLTGTAVGAGLVGRGPGLTGAGPGGAGAARFAQATTLDEAAVAVRVAEESYIQALSRYRQLQAEQGIESESDPATRFAALEYLVAASQAAVRQAPADPFLNGLLASTLAEREAVLRRISSSRDNWF